GDGLDHPRQHGRAEARRAAPATHRPDRDRHPLERVRDGARRRARARGSRALGLELHRAEKTLLHASPPRQLRRGDTRRSRRSTHRSHAGHLHRSDSGGVALMATTRARLVSIVVVETALLGAMFWLLYDAELGRTRAAESARAGPALPRPDELATD